MESNEINFTFMSYEPDGVEPQYKVRVEQRSDGVFRQWRARMTYNELRTVVMEVCS